MFKYKIVLESWQRNNADLPECNFDFSAELKGGNECVSIDEVDEVDTNDAGEFKNLVLMRQFKSWLFRVFFKTSRAEFLLAGAIFGKFNLNEYYSLAEKYSITKDTADEFLKKVGIEPPTRNSRRIKSSDHSFINVPDINGNQILKLQGGYLKMPARLPRFTDFDVTKATRYIAKLIDNCKVPGYVTDFLNYYSTPRRKFSTPATPINESENFSSIPLRILIGQLRGNFHCDENIIWDVLIDSVEPSKIIFRDVGLKFSVILKNESFTLEEILRPQLYIGTSTTNARFKN